MTYFDQIRERGTIPSALRDFMRSAAVFEASQAAAYFYEGTAREEWPMHDWPCLTPPFPRCWIEWHFPQSINSDKFGVRVIDREKEGDGAIAMIDLAENIEGRTVAELYALRRAASALSNIADEPVDTARPRWFFTVTLALSHRRHGIAPLEFEETVCLDAQGRVVPFGYWQVLPTTRRDLVKPVGDTLTNAAYFVLSLLNAVNVPVKPHPIAPALQHARRRRGKPPLVTYSEVVVPGYRYSGNRPSNSTAETAIHMVRGHFKRRKTGIFWWHPHLRGSYDKGVVLSQYMVKPHAQLPTND